MRTTRAALAGLGAAGSLVVAAICALGVASGLIAFNGFPHTGLGSKIRSLVLDGQPAAGRSVTRTTDQLGGQLTPVAGPPVAALGRTVGGSVTGAGQLLGSVLRGARSGSP